MITALQLQRGIPSFKPPPRMTAPGYKRTSSGPKSTSAYTPATDIPRPTLDFRF